ncbi:hypothetical protein LXL04_015280 [Taraxacum kok-saghyz]
MGENCEQISSRYYKKYRHDLCKEKRAGVFLSPDYGHLASKMGSEYLAKLLSQHLESVIKAKISGIVSIINKGIEEMEAELDRLGRPIAVDDGVRSFLFTQYRGDCRESI